MNAQYMWCFAMRTPPQDQPVTGLRVVPTNDPDRQTVVSDRSPAANRRTGRNARWAIAAQMTPSIPERNLLSLSIEELIRACVDKGNAAYWEEFVRRTHGVIAGTVVRTARRFGEATNDLVADLVQDTYLRICENDSRVLRDFRAEFPEAIFGLMKTIAFSVVQDHFRAGFAHKRGSGRPEQPVDTLTEGFLASDHGPADTEKQILLREIDEFLGESEHDRRIFWLYYRHGLTSKAIAELKGIGLTQKGVQSTIHRLTVRVRDWLGDKTHGKGSNEGKGFGSSL